MGAGAANYGALNTSRHSNCDHASADEKSNLDVTCSDMDSSMFETQSQMGESVRYREHVSQYTRERTGELLITIKDRITFFGMSVLVLIPATLLANGIGLVNNEDGEQPLVVENGCNIGLNKWYIFLTAIVGCKLLIEMWRYMFVKMYFQESLLVNLGGNFLLMPIAFIAFFIYTQSMFERSNPDPDHIISYREAQHSTLEQNECVTGDILSQSLYSTF